MPASPDLKTSGHSEGLRWSDQNEAQRFAAFTDSSQFDIVIHLGSAPVRDGPGAQMQMEIGGDQVDEPHGRRI
jgi:hypothetical protein